MSVDLRGTRVALTEFEQAVARMLTEERQRRNCEARVRERKVMADVSGFDVALLGLGAELAFCRLFNCYPNFTSEPRSAGGDCDVILRNGFTVDVKVSRSGDLHVVRWKRPDVGEDLFAVFRGAFPTYTFCGFISREEAIRPERFDREMPEPCYRVPQRDLWGNIRGDVDFSR